VFFTATAVLKRGLAQLFVTCYASLLSQCFQGSWRFAGVSLV